MTIQLKRAYEPPASTDGVRILVERLWPRGISKEKAKIDVWVKEIAPSTALRKWYSHDVERWPEFKKRYEAELRTNADLVEKLATVCERRLVTLVFAAHDVEHSSAEVLLDVLENHVKR